MPDSQSTVPFPIMGANIGITVATSMTFSARRKVARKGEVMRARLILLSYFDHP